MQDINFLNNTFEHKTNKSFNSIQSSSVPAPAQIVPLLGIFIV